jgi:AraC family transcriptional regulator
MDYSCGSKHNNQYQCASGTLQLADCILPYRRALVPGPGVSVYCDRQEPNEWPEHRHDLAKIVVALQSAVCEISWRTPDGGTVQRTIGNGELWVVPSGVSHAKRWLTEADLIMLFLSAGWLQQFGQGLVDDVAVESLKELTLFDPLIAGLTLAMQRYCSVPDRQHAGHVGALGHCLAARMLHGMELRRAGAAKIQRRLGAGTLKRVVDYVEANLGERISLAALAHEARLSPGHFSVLFKATVGMTPEQYILRSRLIRAKAIIMTGAYTVGEVAHMTGFSDHSHLSVQFRRLFGSPPKNWLPPLRTV